MDFFKDNLFAGALIGVAKRFDVEGLPVYDYQQCLKLAGQDERHRDSLNRIFENDLSEKPLILLPIDRQKFWKSVREGDLLVWEQLHEAIIGVGQRDGLQAVCYSCPDCENVLKSLWDISNEAGTLEQSLEEVIQQLSNVNLGDKTPYMVYPL